MNHQKLPLCVDLDGTLLKSDLLMESLFALLKRNALYLFLLPIWLLKGKANLKQQIASRADISIASQPANQAFVDYLLQQKAQGRQLILATASNQKYAQQVADYFGFFDDVIASDAQHNLSGRHKLAALQQRFSDSGFVYAGNDTPDLKIWPHASAAILVNPTGNIASKVPQQCAIEAEFIDDKVGIKAYIKALRCHQWIKNILIFVALVTSHIAIDSAVITQLLMAFFAYSLCASAVYLLNDMLDLEDDRKHPRKCNRPFAAATIPLLHGMFLIPLLLSASLFLAYLIPGPFIWVLIGYFLLTLAYSMHLKRIMMLDVITLAALYTLRVIAGAVAINVVISFWLLAFSMFIFLSLAFVKRSTEVMEVVKLNKDKLSGRGYLTSDLANLNSMGTVSGYLSVLVFALYINSPEVLSHYQHPEALWLICPLLLYWISRIWLIAGRGEMHDDPVVFAISDKASLLTAAVLGALLLVAI